MDGELAIIGQIIDEIDGDHPAEAAQVRVLVYRMALMMKRTLEREAEMRKRLDSLEEDQDKHAEAIAALYDSAHWG